MYNNIYDHLIRIHNLVVHVDIVIISPSKFKSVYYTIVHKEKLKINLIIKNSLGQIIFYVDRGLE